MVSVYFDETGTHKFPPWRSGIPNEKGRAFFRVPQGEFVKNCGCIRCKTLDLFYRTLSRLVLSSRSHLVFHSLRRSDSHLPVTFSLLIIMGVDSALLSVTMLRRVSPGPCVLGRRNGRCGITVYHSDFLRHNAENVTRIVNATLIRRAFAIKHLHREGLASRRICLDPSLDCKAAAVLTLARPAGSHTSPAGACISSVLGVSDRELRSASLVH